jgi:hypothetical protein
MDSKESIPNQGSLAARYDNPTRFLAPIDCLKIPALLKFVFANLCRTVCRKKMSTTTKCLPKIVNLPYTES